MPLFCEDDAVAQSLLKWGNNDERDNEIGAGNTDGVSNAAAHICDTARGSTSRRSISCVPYDRRDLGDLRFALRETEIEGRDQSPTRLMIRGGMGSHRQTRLLKWEKPLLGSMPR